MPESRYKDCKGEPLHAGDRIRHPDGTIGIVVYDKTQKDECRRWRVRYFDIDHTLWLALQVNDKGMAVRHKRVAEN